MAKFRDFEQRVSKIVENEKNGQLADAFIFRDFE
jgi:hypothetical protein